MPVAITSHDVARLAGVSQSTVSRALRDDPRLSEQTRTRVRRAAEALSYVPSEIGRSLSKGSTRRIAMVADVGNPIIPQLMDALHGALVGHDYRMVLFAENGDSDTAAAYEPLFDRSVDGVIVTTARTTSTLPSALIRRGIPFVFLNRTVDGLAAGSCVADNVTGAALVADQFVTDGHTRIAALLGPEETSTGRDRERGFRAALAEAGISLPAKYVARDWFDVQSGIDGLSVVMEARPRPTALFCANDYVAVGAINAALRLGIKVPDDLAIIGFDDLPVASWPVFDLTTIHVPFDEMARQAVDLLLQQINTPDARAERRVVPVRLVLRRSHNRAAVGDLL